MFKMATFVCLNIVNKEECGNTNFKVIVRKGIIDVICVDCKLSYSEFFIRDNEVNSK